MLAPRFAAIVLAALLALPSTARAQVDTVATEKKKSFFPLMQELVKDRPNVPPPYGVSVVANWIEKFQGYRITFTYPVLNRAAEALFLVSGDGKSQILKAVLDPSGSKIYPAQAVQAHAGTLMWLVDREAARLLE